MKRLYFISFLIILMGMTTVPVFAQQYISAVNDDVTIYYQFVNNGDGTQSLYVTYNTNDENDKYSGNVVIPETVTYNGDTYSVTGIADYAFSNCPSLVSVVIPNSVQCINYAAFYQSGLTSVSIGTGVKTIGNYAFSYCYSLSSIVIPENVEYLGEYAFRNCTGLTSVSISGGEGPDVFYGCKNITSVYWDVSILSNYFKDSADKITEIVLGDNVKTIGDYACQNYTALSSISIPDGVTEIGSYAFEKCSILTDLKLPSQLTKIGMHSFDGCLAFTSIDIPDKVTSLGQGAFNGCTNVTSLTLGNSLQEIDSRAFADCTSITSVNIPNSVTKLGNRVFDNCSSLTTATIGSGVTSISTPFTNCVNLTTLSVNMKTFNGTKIIGDTNTSIKELILGDNVEVLNSGGLNRLRGLTSLTVGAGLKDISDDSFDNLNIVTLNWNAENTGKWFSGKNTLQEVVLGDNVKEIDDNAFDGCQAITSFTLGDGLTKIGKSAFYSCTSLTSPVIIPNSVTSIGMYAFYVCEKIPSLTIGSGVTSIGYLAFFGCNALASIDVDEGNSVFDSRENCNALIETASNILIKGCNNSFIPNDVTKIYNYAFLGCTGIETISIPNSVTEIGSRAFDGCDNILVICRQPSPPKANDDSFLLTGGRGLVQKSSIPLYKAAPGWSQLEYISFGLGDINLDGEINTTDITTLYNVIFGTDTITDSTICDINGDGSVNTTDVTALYNIIFGTWDDEIED